MTPAPKSNRDPKEIKVCQLFEKACALSKGELILHENQNRKAPDFWSWIKLKRAAALFKKILTAYPHHWNSMWLLAKVLQRLGDERAAFDWLAKACDENHKNVDVPREASLSAMKLGLSRHAVEYCEEALKLQPGNAGLICNLALAHLHDGKPDEALAHAQSAFETDPKDSVCLNVLRLIRHIVATESACPKTSADLDAYCRKNKGIFRNA